MKTRFLSLICFAIYSTSLAQSANWKFFTPSNTGVGAEEHNFISGDKYGNIWTGGRAVFFNGEGSVVRFNHHDTIFTCWSDFEGYLPGEFIYDAEIDNNDHLWVATGDGLCKYNGLTWTTYTTANTPLPSNNIRSVAIDAQNNIWITFQEVTFTIGGIAKFDGSAWTVYTPSNSNLPGYECKNILIDSQGNKWINSKYSLTKFDGLNFINFNYQNSGLGGPEIYDIALDSLDNIYASTQGPFYGEVNIYNGSTWTTMDQSNTPAFVGISSIYQIYIKGSKMIFSGGGGTHVAIIYDGVNWNTYPSGDPIFDVYIDKDDTFWVSGLTTLSKLDNGQWKDYMRYNTGLSEYNNNDIFIDSKNRLWAANGNGGINLFDCPKWQSYGPYNQGLYPSPQSLSTVGATTCEDSFGNIWFAYNSTNGTVVKIPNGDYQNYAAWQVFDLSNSPVSWIESSVADGFGNVFFYSDYGTHMFNNNTSTWTTWDLTNSPLQYYSYGFGKDSSGKAYFGGHQQIATYYNGVWDSLNLQTMGTTITVVNDIAFDSQNNMWLATEEGVWKYDGTNWTNWTSSNSGISHNHVSSIVINKNDSVFVSSYNAQGIFYGGVSIYNGTSWTTMNIANSDLPSEQIDDMELDSLGNLWINTFTRGVTVYRNGGVLGLDCIDYTLQSSGTTGISVTANADIQNVAAFPNPFSSTTVLEFYLSEPKNVSISIIDVVGRTVKNIPSENLRSGKNKITLDLSELNNGIYFFKTTFSERYNFLKIVKHN